MKRAAQPSLDEFRSLAADHTVVPVWREVLADLETPVSAFVKLVGDGDGFLLESVEHAQRWGRFSFIGRDPALTMVVRGRNVELTHGAAPGVPTDQGALAALEALLARYRAPSLPALPPFHGGVVGYLGYDVVREVERLPDIPDDDLGLPDAVLSLTGHVTAFDHFRQRLYLIENVFVAPGASDHELTEAYERAVSRLDALVDELARPLPYAPSPPPPDELTELPPFHSTMPKGGFHAAVEAAKEYILAGDIFQVVLAQRFDLDERYDPFDVYRVLRQVNPSPYMYFLRHPEATLVGSSPEPMVQVRDGASSAARSRGPGAAGAPRKTTGVWRRAGRAPQGAGRARDARRPGAQRRRSRRALRHRAGRGVDGAGAVLPRHAPHEPGPGELAEGKNAVDVLRATFPAGTVSGAPKVRAMEIIDELEPTKRGPYAGVVGYLDFSGNLDTAITIRTMVWRGGQASVQAGAGVVADSDPELEDLECHNKARALLTAAAASRDLAPVVKQPKEEEAAAS